MAAIRREHRGHELDHAEAPPGPDWMRRAQAAIDEFEMAERLGDRCGRVIADPMAIAAAVGLDRRSSHWSWVL